MDDIDFAFMSEGEATSRYDLKADFYRYARFREYFWDGTSAIAAVRPLAFDRDRAETIRVQYGKNYYVIVEQGLMMLSGPHAARLFLYHKDYPDGVWLGTLQLDGAFYDDKGIKKQLRTAIKQRQYWAAPESDNEIIELKEPELIMELPSEEEILPLRRNCKGFRVLYLSFKQLQAKPCCPKCKIKKKQWRQIKTHYYKVHGKNLIVFQPKPLDKCPPL